MPSADLTLDAWHFESADLRLLRRKICNESHPLSDEFGHPKNGIKTGLTALFEISTVEFEVFRGQNLTLDQLIKPFLVGDNVEKWSPEPPDQFIIRIEKGWTRTQVQTDDESIAWNWFANRFPQVAPRFLLHKDKAMARSDQGDFWWELRACDYYSEFDRPKICIPEMSQGPKFARDVSGCTLNNKVFFLPYSPELIGYMNSRLAWFYLFGRCAQLRGGKWRLELREQYISTLPIPAKGLGHDPSLAFQSSLAADAAGSRTQRISIFLRRIPDLCPSDRRPKLTERLKQWWNLDFKSFQAEIKKAFKADIPLKQRGDWENFLREEGEKVRRLTVEIEQAEREIDAIVYKLFDLTPDEIAVLESSLAGQY
jgi:hypothetical protein